MEPSLFALLLFTLPFSMPLFVCATPLGHLDDVSLRLLATLREVDLIVAEDTRHTQRLLARHDIHTPSRLAISTPIPTKSARWQSV